MSADAADMPVKPRMPATIDTRKKISAHLRSVIADASAGAAPTVRRARSKSLIQLRGAGLVPISPPPAAIAVLQHGNWALLNRVPDGNIPATITAGTRNDHHFRRGVRGDEGGAEGQSAQRRARSRPHLPDAGGA